MTTPTPWGHLCLCQHLISDHRLRPGGDLKKGPYDCIRCGDCAISQDSPSTPISEQRYRDLRRQQTRATR